MLWDPSRDSVFTYNEKAECGSSSRIRDDADIKGSGLRRLLNVTRYRRFVDRVQIELTVENPSWSDLKAEIRFDRYFVTTLVITI